MRRGPLPCRRRVRKPALPAPDVCRHRRHGDPWKRVRRDRGGGDSGGRPRCGVHRRSDLREGSGAASEGATGSFPRPVSPVSALRSLPSRRLARRRREPQPHHAPPASGRRVARGTAHVLHGARRRICDRRKEEGRRRSVHQPQLCPQLQDGEMARIAQVGNSPRAVHSVDADCVCSEPQVGRG